MAGVGGVGRIGRIGAFGVGGGWSPIPGTLPDLDFANNRWFGVSSFASALSVTRTSPSDYAQKLDGSWQSFAAGVARITDKGILAEESRTNGIRNNSGQGAGSGGALPTNWASSLPAGLALTCSTAGTENGVEYCDITISGTAGASTDGFVSFEGSQVIAAVISQTWANSFFIKNISGVMPTTYNRIRERDVSGNQLAVLSSTIVLAGSSANLGQSRQIFVATTTNASTAFVRPTIEFTFVNATVYNFTFRIGWPQCELGASATSPIRTTTVAVTRAADAISVNSSSSFVTANASGIYLKIRPLIVSGGGTRTFVSVVVDGQNRHSFYVNASTGTVNFSTVTASASQYFLASTSGMVADTAYKTAARWQANSAALRVPTALTSPANNTSNTQPTGTPTIWLGSLSGSSVFANGYIERVALFLTPPSDAVLDALVA